MEEQKFSMVEECTDSYVAERQKDGRLIITMDIPKRFSHLWISKLSDLTTTMKEIKEYEPED